MQHCTPSLASQTQTPAPTDGMAAGVREALLAQLTLLRNRPGNPALGSGPAMPVTLSFRSCSVPSSPTPTVTREETGVQGE